MSVADQINRIKTNISNAYSAAEAKGATIPEVKNSDNLSACVQSITTGGGGTQFGLTVEQMLGTVDSNGTLTQPSLSSMTFTGVKTIADSAYDSQFANKVFDENSIINFPDLEAIGSHGMDGCFHSCSGIKKVNFNKLTIANEYSLKSAFSSSQNLESINFPLLQEIQTNGMNGFASFCQALTSIDFPLLEKIYDSGMVSSFSNCQSLTSINFPSLVFIDGLGMDSTFEECTSITNVSFPALKEIEASGMKATFYGCTALQSISFPALTTVNSAAFGARSNTNYCFGNCTALTAIHFPAAMQAAIESMQGYSAKWGATNATIYFDL